MLGFAKIIKKRLEDRIFPLVPTDDRKVAQTIQQVEDNLKVVVSEGERLTKLIDDVLDLAKIEAGKLEWHMEAGRRRRHHRSRHRRDVVALRAEGPAPRQARRAGPAGGHRRSRSPDPGRHQPDLERGEVHRRGHRSPAAPSGADGDLVVSVIDTGLGIAPADQPKVFERFKQVGDTLTDKPKGTGLGLPICREIVEHHGGRIWVRERARHRAARSRSRCRCRPSRRRRRRGPIELAALIRQLRDQVVVTTPRTAERQPRILVVDDDANIRELLMQEFTEAGYRVTAGRQRARGVASRPRASGPTSSCST